MQTTRLAQTQLSGADCGKCLREGRMHMSRLAATLMPALAVSLLIFSATASFADAIDGDWCNADGKRMSIRGPEIVTPGGKQTRGDYTRHSFAYIVPPGEAGAGDAVQIILRGEYLAQARTGKGEAPWQDWRRCPATTS